MIQLFQYAPNWGLPNVSPFCMKLECLLRMAKLPYQVITLPDPRKSPTGKLPFIQDEDTTIADSSLIMKYLNDQYQLELDKDLNAKQKVLSTALQRTFEDHLYWAIVYSRWIEPAGWSQVKASYFSSMPTVLQLIVPQIVRSSIKKSLSGHGLGRNSPEDIYSLSIQDLNIIQHQLTDNKYIVGTDSPSTIDAIAYAFISNILLVPIESPLKAFTAQHPCFQRYCDDMNTVWHGYSNTEQQSITNKHPTH